MEDLKNKMIRFLNSIGILNTDDFDMEFSNIIKSSFEKDFYTFSIIKNSGWDYKYLEQFLNALSNIKSYKYTLIFDYKENLKNEKLKSLIKDFYFNEMHKEAKFDISFNNDVNSNELKLIANSEELEQSLKDFLPEINNLFETINYHFVLKIYNITKVAKKVYKEVEISDVHKEVVFEEVKKETEDELIKIAKDNYELMLEERRQHDLFKKGDYVPHNISELDSNSAAVDINGRVFEVELRETKTGKLSARVGVDDGSDAIYCTLFSNETALKREDLLKISVNQMIRIKGRMSIDKYNNNQLFIMGHYFYNLPPIPLRDDDSAEKRIELHLHTKMSEMDGVSFFEDYVKTAKNMGHKAIAITDHGGVQGFPNAQEVCKKYGIKGLYGAELYLIDDYLHASINAKGSKLDGATYVVLDTETTGLSMKYDRITEIGAVKVVGGVVTERMDVLINPEIHIPLMIQKKTNITEEMVKNEPTIKEVLPRLLKFLEGSILVTHNLEFDYGMINQAMIDNGFGPLTIEAIDTLPLSRYLFPKNAYHNLGSLCKRYDVLYEDNKAHRADYDAEVLASVWISMRSELLKTNQDMTTNDISNLVFDNDMLAHYKNTYHAIVLAKNYDGVKELYQIISDSRINTIGYYPFTKKSILNKYRKNLFVGSACFNGEVFQSAMIKNDDYLRKAIKEFDYIEIQPLANYSFLINDGQILDENRLKDIIRNIIRIADEENKMICATGDCHYVNPSDKVYRDIIIHATQVGGKYHPLNNNQYNKPDVEYFINPDQHYRSTDEMLTSFEWLGKEKAYEYVITNTNKIADQIEELVPVKLDTYNPVIEGSDKLLTDLVYSNAHNLYGEKLDPIIEDRIKKELDGIINNGYATLYWIAHLLVKKSNDDGWIVGSRGSVGSSFVATMSNITEVNPLPPHYRCPNCKHTEFYKEDVQMSGFDLPEKRCPVCGEIMVGDGQSIPFQTFLGFNADKTPDIDLNFATNYQATAHNYTKVLLGENNVYRAGTISAVQFKTAYGYVCNYVKDVLHWSEEKINAKRAKISSLSFGCIEIKRTTGQHPAGIVVVPNNYVIEDFTPVQYPADDKESQWKTTHFDFTSMHDTLLKLDILAHLDPQSIKMMLDLTGLKIEDVKVNDPQVLSIFTSDKALNLAHKYLPFDNGATGLPEFGTDFVRQVLRESQPKTFRDLVIISGLTHGEDVWNNNERDLVLNEGKALKDLIGCRDDIMVYLMNKGLDHSNAFKIMETVRKKDKQLNSEQIKDMLDHNVPEYYIESCKKIKYMFPKGHATAYVIMALRVCYFKVYYPLEYYATFFTLRSDSFDIEAMSKGWDAVHERLTELYNRRASNNPELKLSKKEEDIIITLEVALEMYERGYKIENIDINKSQAFEFIINKENKSIIPPFRTIDGVGLTNSESFVKARKEKAFTSKDDILKRSGFSSTNVKALEHLGCLKGLDDTDQMSLFDFNF